MMIQNQWSCRLFETREPASQPALSEIPLVVTMPPSHRARHFQELLWMKVDHFSLALNMWILNKSVLSP
jgi:hypothetical protein